MPVAFLRQPCIPFPAIRVDHGPWFNRIGHKALQAGRRGIRNMSHSDATDGMPLFFCSNDNQSLLFRLPAADAGFAASLVGLVHLDPSRQSFPARSDHDSAKLMQPRPRGLVAAQTQNLLQAEGAGPRLWTGNPPNHTKPQNPRFACAVKHRARRYRRLRGTGCTLHEDRPNPPALRMPATRTTKTVRPAQTAEVIQASLFGGET